MLPSEMLKSNPTVTMKGHQGPITQVRYNKSGEFCVSCGDDKLIMLWNPHDATKIKTYQGHGQSVRDATASHDNCHLGSASADRCAFYWDVASGTILRRFRGHETIVNCVRFNYNSTLLLSGGNDSIVRIMDLKSRSWEPVQMLDDAKDSITSIDMSNDEIIVGSVDGRVRLYDIRMGKVHEDFVGEAITNVRFSHDYQSILVSTTDSVLRLMDKTSGQLLNDYTGHTHTKVQLQAASWYDDSAVLSTCEKSKVYLWDFISGSVKQVLELSALAQTLDVHPSRYHLLTGSLKGNIDVWKVKGEKKEEEKEGASSMSRWALPPR